MGDIVIVDVGFKSEGTISKIEFFEGVDLKLDRKLKLFLKVLKIRKVILYLSKQRADFLKNLGKEFSEHTKLAKSFKVKLLKELKAEWLSI